MAKGTESVGEGDPTCPEMQEKRQPTGQWGGETATGAELPRKHVISSLWRWERGCSGKCASTQVPSAGAESPHPVYHLLGQGLELCVGFQGNTLLPHTSIWSR